MGWIPAFLIVMLLTIVGLHIHTMRMYRRFRTVEAGVRMTGAQVARELLDRHGLSDVAVREVNGVLSDRYDLRARVVRLSRENFRSTSIAALGIAAHEIGHALQAHETGHTPIKNSGGITLRTATLLIQMAGWGAVIAFFMLFNGWLFQWSDLMRLGMVVFLGAVGCSLLTLPVELNASRRALELLSSGEYLTDREMAGARTVLRAAAWSYVAAAGTALVQLFRD